MGLIILLLLVGMPILEISVFIRVGDEIGLFNTIAIVILTAIAGTILLRWQGLSVLSRAQESLRENRFPLEEVFDGLCLVVAGALLLTPGFVTDGIGFLLFLPPVRASLKQVAARVIAKRATVYSRQAPGGRPAAGEPVIDGEYEDITEKKRGDTGDATQIEQEDPDRRDTRL